MIWCRGFGNVRVTLIVPTWFIGVLLAAKRVALLFLSFDFQVGCTSSNIWAVMTSQFAPVSQYALRFVLSILTGIIGSSDGRSLVANGMYITWWALVDTGGSFGSLASGDCDLSISSGVSRINPPLIRPMYMLFHHCGCLFLILAGFFSIVLAGRPSLVDLRLVSRNGGLVILTIFFRSMTQFFVLYIYFFFFFFFFFVCF